LRNYAIGVCLARAACWEDLEMVLDTVVLTVVAARMALSKKQQCAGLMVDGRS
jgi:hypothetical protein